MKNTENIALPFRGIIFPDEFSLDTLLELKRGMVLSFILLAILELFFSCFLGSPSILKTKHCANKKYLYNERIVSLALIEPYMEIRKIYQSENGDGLKN
jgi:hypothetical protein